MATEVHVGDIGTIIRLTIKDQDKAVIDLSSATTKQIILGLPAGTSSTKTAVFFSDGTDGVIQYVTVSGDLSVSGPWKVQGRIVLSGGADFKTEIKDMTVVANV
jgi:hypothetical protein